MVKLNPSRHELIATRFKEKYSNILLGIMSVFAIVDEFPFDK